MVTAENTLLPNEALKILFHNLEENEKKILLLYTQDSEVSFTQEDVKRLAELSTNDARVSLYKLEATLFIVKKIKGRGNKYVLTENGRKVTKNLRKGSGL